MRTISLGSSLAALIDYRGKTPKKLGADFTAAGVPVLSAQLVANGAINLQDARRVSQDTHDAWMTIPTKRGDVLLTSEAPLGRVARVPSDEPLVLGQRLFGLRGLPGILDNGYLYYVLQTERVQADLASRATGSTVSGIRQSALRTLLIPLPEVEQQRAIAEVLGALDDKIDANTRLAATTDELAASLARAALSPARPVALSAVATITMGSSPPGTSLNEDGKGVVFYQGVRDFQMRSPRNRVWTTEPARMAVPGDCLLSVRAPVGDLNVATEPTCIGRGLASIRSTTGSPWTLFHVLRNSTHIWAPFEAEGTVFGSINKTQLANVKIATVVDRDPQKLEADLCSLELRIQSALREDDSLSRIRDTLLPALMSGRLRVKAAQAVAESVL